MSYFLKKSKLKYGVYLQIYETIYDKISKRSSNKCFKKLGYLDNLKTKEITDPLSYYKEIVAQMNNETVSKKREAKKKLITNNTIKNIGYFLPAAVWDNLNLDDKLEKVNFGSKFDYKIQSFLKPATMSRFVSSFSEGKDYNDVIPTLYNYSGISKEEVVKYLEFCGSNFKTLISIINESVNDLYIRDENYVFFNQSHYYFDTDFSKISDKNATKNDYLSRPVLNNVICVDEDGIPIDLSLTNMFQKESLSEKALVDYLKAKAKPETKIIKVADKVSVLDDDFYSDISLTDGFIYSKSCRNLHEEEHKWITNKSGYKEIKTIDGNVVYKIKSIVKTINAKIKLDDGTIKNFPLKQKRIATFNIRTREIVLDEIDKMVLLATRAIVSQEKILNSTFLKYTNYHEEGIYKICDSLNKDQIDLDKEVAGYGFLVTSICDKEDTYIYSIFRNLIHFKQSFDILKTQLDGQLSSLKSVEHIYGHFLIRYYATFLIRLLEFRVFKERYRANEITTFTKNLRIANSGNYSVNISSPSIIVDELSLKYQLPLNHYFLNEKEIKKIFDVKVRVKK